MLRKPWPNPPKKPKKKGIYKKLNASRRQLAPSLQPPVTLTIHQSGGGEYTDGEIKVSVISQIPGEDYNGPTPEVEISIKRTTGIYSSLMSLFRGPDLINDITFVDCNYPRVGTDHQLFARLCVKWIRQDLEQIFLSVGHGDPILQFKWEVKTSTSQDVRTFLSNPGQDLN